MNECIRVGQPVALLGCYEAPPPSQPSARLQRAIPSCRSSSSPYISYGVQIRPVCWPIKHSTGNPVVIQL